MNRSKSRAGNETCQGTGSAANFARFRHSAARVVEWQTRTFEGRMPKGMRVQVPPRAPNPQCAKKFLSNRLGLKPLAKNDLARRRQPAEKSTEPLPFRHAIPYSMPRERKREDRPTNAGAAKYEGGSTVCALCASVIKPGSATSHEPVIYSICSTCKRMPRHNPGSIESLC